MEKVNASLVNVEFGERMATVRRVRRMSQSDVGEIIGLSRATIANLESGRQNVQLHQVYAIARALNSPVEQFLPAPDDVYEDIAPAEDRGEAFLRYARQQLLNEFGDDDENT